MAEKRKFTQQEQVRRQKLEELANLGIDPFGQKYDVETYTSDIRREYGSCTKEELEEKKVSVQIAGRIIRRRRKGKVCFMDLLDRDGSIQLYVRKDVVGEEIYEIVKRGDLGDIIGVKGELMVTDMGELTVRVDEYTHLSKALRPLPEKFHGLTDTEERFRRRYVDLIMNEEARKVAFTRPKIIRSIQNYLDSKHFVEVETPIMNNILGGAAAKPFVTHFNALDSDFYLRIATELNLKRLIVGGMDAVYEIGRLFRNEGMDLTHNPEFTTVELYEAYGDLSTMMELQEGVLRHICETVTGKYEYINIFNPEGEKIDLSKPFRRVTMCELIQEYTGVDFKGNNYSLEEAKAIAKEHGIEVEPHYTVGHIINEFFEKYCEHHLVQPTFLCGHPIEISPLTKKDPTDPRFVERFELFICGKEFSNAYTELNDPIDQLERFKAQLAEREAGNDEANEIDQDFVEALEYGMPPCGGIGMGIDRLVMFFTEQSSIREVLLFPQMKPRGKQE